MRNFLVAVSLAQRKEIMLTIMITGKSFSEVLIPASTNPQYDKRLSSELPVQYMKIPSSEHVLSLEFSCTELVIQWTIFCHIVG